MDNSSVPYGYCQCGCGEKTTISDKTRPQWGHIKGEPVGYIVGHNARIKQPMNSEEHRAWWVSKTDVEYGTCWCGCAGATTIARHTNGSRSAVKGFPKSYIQGHHRRLKGPRYLVDPKTGCWVWQGPFNRTGYGRMWDNNVKRLIMAHRTYYEKHKGPIPKGLVPDHLCRNRACVNPEHIEPVTGTENIRRGAGTKLTMQLARRIRTLHFVYGINISELARRYSVARDTIRKLLKGKTWKE